MDEGTELLEKLVALFDGVVVMADPQLPVSEGVVSKIQEPERLAHPKLKYLRPPLYTINDIKALVQNRYDSSHDCNLYLFRLNDDNEIASEPAQGHSTPATALNDEDFEPLSESDASCERVAVGVENDRYATLLEILYLSIKYKRRSLCKTTVWDTNMKLFQSRN